MIFISVFLRDGGWVGCLVAARIIGARSEHPHASMTSRVLVRHGLRKRPTRPCGVENFGAAARRRITHEPGIPATARARADRPARAWNRLLVSAPVACRRSAAAAG